MTVAQTCDTESSLFAFGTRASQPVVLKILKQRSDEWRCAEVLQAFDGRGVVRVYEHVDGAVLMERAMPGGHPGRDPASLAAMAIDGRDEEATAILADVIARMAGTRAPAACPTVREWGRSFQRYINSGDRKVDADLVEEASRCYEQLAASQSKTMLLHGDLHHDNVVHDAHRGWLAIDPKGVVAELEFEIGAALRNPIKSLDLVNAPRTIERRVQQFAHVLNLDADRVVRWAFAQAVLAAIWDVEDHQASDPTSPWVALAIALRAMHPRMAHGA